MNVRSYCRNTYITALLMQINIQLMVLESKKCIVPNLTSCLIYYLTHYVFTTKLTKT